MNQTTKFYDEINPSHYVGKTGIESKEVLDDYGFTPHLYTAMKYIFRAGRKPGVSPIKDMEKALWFVERALKKDAIIRTFKTEKLASGFYVSDKAPTAVQIVEDFEIVAPLKFGVLTLFAIIDRRGEVRNSALIRLKDGIEEELESLRAYRETFGYDRRKDGFIPPEFVSSEAALRSERAAS